MSRKAARECAFSLIYEIPFHDTDAHGEVINMFLNSEHVKNITDKDSEYIRTTVLSCFDNIGEIDEKISSSLKKWTIDRLSKVDLSVLRLSLSETKYSGVPLEVSINEAVELAKKFGDDDSPSFINGVLADINR